MCHIARHIVYHVIWYNIYIYKLGVIKSDCLSQYVYFIYCTKQSDFIIPSLQIALTFVKHKQGHLHFGYSRCGFTCLFCCKQTICTGLRIVGLLRKCVEFSFILMFPGEASVNMKVLLIAHIMHRVFTGKPPKMQRPTYIRDSLRCLFHKSQCVNKTYMRDL